MTSKTTDKDAFVWIWLPDTTEPVVAGKLESDDQGNVQFNYGKRHFLGIVDQNVKSPKMLSHRVKT